MTTDCQACQRLAAYLATQFPEVDATAPVDAALWLLEHLHRIEGMQPPLLRTLHARPPRTALVGAARPAHPAPPVGTGAPVRLEVALTGDDMQALAGLAPGDRRKMMSRLFAERGVRTTQL